MKALAFVIIGPIALLVYCRNGTALGWYRGCGRAPPASRA